MIVLITLFDLGIRKIAYFLKFYIYDVTIVKPKNRMPFS